MLQAVKVAGASEIFVVVVSDERRQKAIELGANYVINPIDTDEVAFIREKTNGGVNVAYDTAGVQATFSSGVSTVRSDGEFKIVSVWEKPVNFDPNIIVRTEAKISDSYAYVRLFPEVIPLLASGVIDGNAVITSNIALDDIVEKGFEMLTKDRSECKILVNMSL